MEQLPGDAGVAVVGVAGVRHHRREAVPGLYVAQHAVGALPHRQPLPRVRHRLDLFSAQRTISDLFRRAVTLPSVPELCPDGGWAAR